jgi:hypothetical protein
MNWPSPQNDKKVGGFLSVSRYYKTLIKNYRLIIHKMSNQLKKDTTIS